MKTPVKIGIGTALAITVIGGAIAIIHHLSVPRIIARESAPDGTEFCIIQKCNWSAELFTTSCYYRKPGGPWGRYYYDHEDWYWRRAHVEVDTASKQFRVHRNGAVTAMFDWETETFRLRRQDFQQRDIQGPQSLMPRGWSP